jgi:hypothetical protein
MSASTAQLLKAPATETVVASGQSATNSTETFFGAAFLAAGFSAFASQAFLVAQAFLAGALVAQVFLAAAFGAFSAAVFFVVAIFFSPISKVENREKAQISKCCRNINKILRI